jgi:hypothetical protein
MGFVIAIALIAIGYVVMRGATADKTPSSGRNASAHRRRRPSSSANSIANPVYPHSPVYGDSHNHKHHADGCGNHSDNGSWGSPSSDSSCGGSSDGGSGGGGGD